MKITCPKCSTHIANSNEKIIDFDFKELKVISKIEFSKKEIIVRLKCKCGSWFKIENDKIEIDYKKSGIETLNYKK